MKGGDSMTASQTNFESLLPLKVASVDKLNEKGFHFLARSEPFIVLNYSLNGETSRS